MNDTPEPTDPLVAKLLDIFTAVDPPPDSLSTLGKELSPLLGVPIEQVAREMNADFAVRAARLIAATRASEGAAWNPADWMLIAPSYLFNEVTEDGRLDPWMVIDDVRITRSDLGPDWMVFLIKTPEAMLRESREAGPLQFPAGWCDTHRAQVRTLLTDLGRMPAPAPADPDDFIGPGS